MNKLFEKTAYHVYTFKKNSYHLTAYGQYFSSALATQMPVF